MVSTAARLEGIVLLGLITIIGRLINLSDNQLSAVGRHSVP